MDSIVKEKLVATEKEEDERLMKEGFKEISNGKGFIVLSNAVEPSYSVSSINGTKNNFNLGDAQLVTTNFSIDRHIKMKNPPDPLVFIKLPSSKIVKSNVVFNFGFLIPVPLECSVIPCAAFMRYIDSFPIVGTVEKGIEKKKGFTSRFQTSVEVKASASAGFLGCEASLEVTTGFEYEETVTSETTITWKQTLTEGSYIVYQNAIVYAYIFTPYIKENTEKINRLNPGVNLKHVPALNAAVMFVPVNRNDPFTLRYQDSVYEPVEYDDLVSYLIANPSKWKA